MGMIRLNPAGLPIAPTIPKPPIVHRPTNIYDRDVRQSGRSDYCSMSEHICLQPIHTLPDQIACQKTHMES